MNLIGHIPGVGPTALFNPGPTTPAPWNVAQTGATDGTGPADATKNMAEIYNRLLLSNAAIIQAAGLAIDNDNWVQVSQAIQAIAAAAAAAANAPVSLGQCRLSKSGANLILLPFNGNKILVNGVVCTVPDAGVTLAPPAVASTTYNIYAVATAGVITSLENSATAHSTDTAAGANKGVEIKAGDPTRSMVGIARTTAANAWADTAKQAFVVSWFNRVQRVVSGTFTAQRNTGSATPIELNTEIRVEFLTLGVEPVQLIFGGTINSGSDAASSYASVAIDSTTVPTTVVTNGSNLYSPLSAPTFKAVAEGYHYATALGWAGGTTGYFGNGTNHNNLEGVIG